MPYVEGYIIPLKKKDVKAYAKMAQKASKIWLDHGALEFKECVCEELKAKWGPGFAKGLRLKPNETVYFSWVKYKTKAHRKAVNKKIMADPRMAKLMQEGMAFDPKRMMYGGFKVMVDE